ncbi:MAG: 3-methyl-2-oxobutanoate hydroxymethyltransferase, partial [Fusobacteriota bacterium]
LETIKKIIDLEIPVVGHLGLTPQSVNSMGGFKVQGKTKEEAKTIIKDAKDLEKAGVFCIVIEGVPSSLAKKITEAVEIPIIGIGAGKDVDGQVLVYYDMLGYTDWVPKFVKKYENIGQKSIKAIKEYVDEVKKGEFPKKENMYS